MKFFKLFFFLGVLLAVTTFSATGQNNRLPSPLLTGLGNLQFPVTTKSDLAQRYFNQGLTLCYAFNHEEAIRSFQSAAHFDPDCAMAYWGIAYANGPHVNKPMTEQDNVEAWEAIQNARARAANASPKERAMIQAMSDRYEASFREDRSDLDKAYAAAMRAVVAEYSDDTDLQTMFAEALMDTMPWDYWLKDRSPKPETEEALRALKFALSRDPDHPGANHLLIHAVEAGPQPESGLPSADRLLNFAPAAGHLVHMPSHIYMRVGQYEDAVNANVKAVKADERYIRQARSEGFYPGVYYPHNIHFLWWAQLYEGRSKEALRTANQAARYAVDNYCGPSRALEAPRFRHLPCLTLLRFGEWDAILKMPKPVATNDFLIDRAVWHFARGLAFAAQNDSDAASRELTAYRELTRKEDATKLDTPQLPVTSIFAVAEHWLAGRVAEAKGDRATMIRELEKAVALEDEMPYMEPAYWPITVRPALGAALLRAGMPKEAEEVFRADLQDMPRNGWGLRGLEQALRDQGRPDAALTVHKQFNQTWKNADVPLDLRWF